MKLKLFKIKTTHIFLIAIYAFENRKTRNADAFLLRNEIFKIDLKFIKFRTKLFITTGYIRSMNNYCSSYPWLGHVVRSQTNYYSIVVKRDSVSKKRKKTILLCCFFIIFLILTQAIKKKAKKNLRSEMSHLCTR